jgi:heme exporter protein D
MSLGPYAPFVLISYLIVALVVTILITWIAFDFLNQMRRLRVLGARGLTRRSGRDVTDME